MKYQSSSWRFGRCHCYWSLSRAFAGVIL